MWGAESLIVNTIVNDSRIKAKLLEALEGMKVISILLSILSSKTGDKMLMLSKNFSDVWMRCR